MLKADNEIDRLRKEIDRLRTELAACKPTWIEGAPPNIVGDWWCVYNGSVCRSYSLTSRQILLCTHHMEAERDFLKHRAARASAARYQALRARYAVRVDAAATTAQ
jgi:hypothetical protein